MNKTNWTKDGDDSQERGAGRNAILLSQRHLAAGGRKTWWEAGCDTRTHVTPRDQLVRSIDRFRGQRGLWLPKMPKILRFVSYEIANKTCFIHLRKVVKF